MTKGRKTKVQSWYLDLTMIRQYWGSDRAYHHTAPISDDLRSSRRACESLLERRA